MEENVNFAQNAIPTTQPAVESTVSPMTIPPDVIAAAQAEMERKQRAQRVAQMIQHLLQREQCTTSPSVTITANGTQFNWGIIALPLEDNRIRRNNE